MHGETIEPDQIIIKDIGVMTGMLERRFSPLLVLIVVWVAKKYGVVLTESYRPKRHRNDLHGTLPVRAVDIRSWCYPDSKAYQIMHEINQKWEYDPKRPDKMVAIVHNSGKGIHMHIQVHPNTQRRAYI